MPVVLSISPTVCRAATYTFNFNTTTLPAPNGPVNPVNGIISVYGTNLNIGDVLVFDGIIINVPGSTADAWGAVELNYGGGYLGVVNASLGVLVETGTASGNPCQLFVNGASSSTAFGTAQGSATNRLRIQLTCTQSGSTTNMNYLVRVDQGLTGTFSGTLAGTGVNFANNTINLVFGANTSTHLFTPTQPTVTTSGTTTIAAGTKASFAASISQGYSFNTYEQWLSNGVPIIGATGLTYMTPATTSAYNGTQYSIIVSNQLSVSTNLLSPLVVRSVPGLVPFTFNATTISDGGQINPLSPPAVIPGSMLLAGDTVVFDGMVATNGTFSGSDGWASISLSAGGFQGVTGAQFGLLIRLGTGASQLYVNGTGPVSPNPTSSGALTNRVRIELYPSVTGSTTNMGWLVKVDQNLTGTFLPAVTGTNLTFAGNSIPLSFAAYHVPALVTALPVGLEAFHQILSTTNLIVGAFDQVAVTEDSLNLSNVVISPATPGLVYASSNTNVVTVSSDGYLQAIGIGQATISTTLSSWSASNTVSVVNPGALLGVSLKVNNSMPLFSNQQASVLGTFANVTNFNLLKYEPFTPTFTSSNTNVFTISTAGLITAIGPGTSTVSVVDGGVSAASQPLNVLYPANRFIFDNFGDGFWTISNQGNASNLVVTSGGVSQVAPNGSDTNEQFELLYNYQNSTFRIRNRATWQCIGANGLQVVPVNYNGGASQQWYLVDVGSGYFRIINALNSMALQTDNGNPANVTLANVSSNSSQYWNFAYQAHYPKKGCAGYEGDYAQFELNWAYNYDDHTSISLPAAVDFVPMIYAAQYYEPLSDAQTRNTGWLSQAAPAYLLAYNEPDNTVANGGSNTGTNAVIFNWPAIQALNLPLVGPAVANTFDDWQYSFYNLIASNNYRVDYTAVHEYVPPNASSLIGQLQSVYATFGRPVWLTEFSPVDWSNTQSWSEDDDYNFLAEFMWQAEGQEWLKRYAIFPFSGTNNASPWVDNGYRGNFFLADGATLSPYGELYAAWDGNLTLQARTPYIIHNLATSFRLTATNNTSFPVASDIYVRNATTEWALLPAPTTNHWYIISLNDGRRLRDVNGTLIFAAPASTGSTVEWEFSGPDSSGYYFITNSAGHSLNSSGMAPAITFNTTTSGTQNNNNRWRFVKPYQPVAVYLATPPINLAFIFTNQMIALNWSTDNNLYYNIYRSTTPGGPYSAINQVATNNYTDISVQAGVTYYYVVTGLNILGEESAYSTAVTAPATASSPTTIVASFSSSGLQLSWPADHVGWLLQMQTNAPGFGLGTNWVTIGSSNSTNQFLFPNNLNYGSAFYRLLYP